MEYAVALTPETMAFDPPMVRRTQRGHARDVPTPSFQPGALVRYVAKRAVVPLTSDNPSGKMSWLGNLRHICARSASDRWTIASHS